MDSQIEKIKTEQIAADLSKVVDRVSKQYDRPDIAFQKEAIQNSWDERADLKHGNNWLIKINTFTDEVGKTHVVIEDFGTHGMNIEKWEGFSSLWKPKKSFIDAAGGKGQGKFVLMNASKEHILFVESISSDGYLCKFLQDGKKSSKEASLNISTLISGAKQITHIGTKVWIFDAKEEFLNTLRSEDFINSITESWWQVLGPRFNGNIFLFEKKVSHLPLPTPIEEQVLLENYKIENFGRIKRLHLGYYSQTVHQGFDGIMVQRGNMTIRQIPFEIYDKTYQGRFSGYIEFDEMLEKYLKDIERNDHSNFLYESPWKEIKNLIENEADKFISKIIPSKQQRKSINIKNLSEVIQKTNQIVNEYCPEIMGGGTVVPPIKPKEKSPIRIKNLSVNKREVK